MLFIIWLEKIAEKVNRSFVSARQDHLPIPGKVDLIIEKLVILAPYKRSFGI